MQFIRAKYLNKARLERGMEYKLMIQAGYMKESGCKIREVGWGLRCIRMATLIKESF